ncbi:hypothetical protein ACFQL1_23985 [Halomicroarcula sp. GCM10025709]
MNQESGDGDSQQLSITDQLTSEYNTVFKNKDLIEPDTIVDEDRIVGRDEQLNKVINIIKPALHGDQPRICCFVVLPVPGKLLSPGLSRRRLSISVKHGISRWSS